MARRNLLLPLIATAAGIATFSAMDAAMKGASIAAGVYTALLIRSYLASLLILPAWLLAGSRKPSAAALRVHYQRSLVVAAMAPPFFWGLVRLPIAEAIALSFIAPLIALYFASLLLGERIRRMAILASLLGIAGVVVIAAGRFGQGAFTRDSLLGMAAILTSAVLYALNLVLQRRQALLAGPLEIAFVQNLFVAVIFTVPLPWLFAMPDIAAVKLILLAAVLALAALLLLSWGYARAEAQVLMPIEYTGFAWAALYGWLFFGETVSPAMVAGAALIVIGCLIAARGHTEQTAV
jgi:drug/metabolite transporter (DMT)-like permease